MRMRIDTSTPIFNSTSVAPAFLAARIARSISAWLILAGRFSCRPREGLCERRAIEGQLLPPNGFSYRQGFAEQVIRPGEHGRGASESAPVRHWRADGKNPTAPFLRHGFSLRAPMMKAQSASRHRCAIGKRSLAQDHDGLRVVSRRRPWRTLRSTGSE